MNRIHDTIFLLLIAAFLYPCAAFAQQDTDTHIDNPILNVLVVNATQNNTPIASTEVQVNIYHDQKLTKKLSDVTDDSGRCSFTDIFMGEGVFAVVQAKNGNMYFSSGTVPLPHQHKPFEVTVQTFDVSNDRSQIKSGTHHIILRLSADHIFVTEYVQLINDTNKAISSDILDANEKPRVIEMNLPKGFQQLQSTSYFILDALTITEDGFYDTMAIPPGKFHAVYTYQLPLKSRPLKFTKTITIPSKNITVFAQLEGSQLNGLEQPAGQVNLQDGSTAEYYSVDIPDSNKISFEISGVKTTGSKNQTWIILSTVFAIVIAAGIYNVFKKENTNSEKSLEN